MWVSLSIFLFALFSPAIARAGHDHTVAGFLGVKHLGSSTSLAIGAEYEYLPSSFLGITGFGEYALADPGEISLGVGLALHPVPLFGLKLVAIPGLELVDSNAEFLFRTGAAYEMSIGPAFIGPAFYLDFTGGHIAHVIGMIVGAGI